MERILIVDDQACVREVVSEELFHEGYGVESVGDAESLKRCLMASRPDLVLLDLHLDGPSGFNLLADIKKEYPHLPVVILTAYDSYKDDPRLSQADGYVVKSGLLDELKEKVSDILKSNSPTETTTDVARIGDNAWRMA